MIENLGGMTPFICYILLIILMAFFSLRFIFFAEKFAEERGYQENTAIVIRLLGAFMASYLITAIVILLGDNQVFELVFH